MEHSGIMVYLNNYLSTWQSKAWIDGVQQSSLNMAEQSMDRWRPTIISPHGRAKQDR